MKHGYRAANGIDTDIGGQIEVADDKAGRNIYQGDICEVCEEYAFWNITAITLLAQNIQYL